MKVRNLLLATFTSGVLFISCKDNGEKNTIAVQDTAGLAAFNQQKLLNAQLADQQAKIDSLAQIKALQMNAAAAATAPVALVASGSGNKKVSNTSTTSSKRSYSSSSSSSGNDDYNRTAAGSRSTNDDYANAPVATSAPQKKGISKAAKGTIIGAGTGAVAGAIINKRKPGVGAVVGGVVGGAAGYGIGRSQDKKDGRY